MIKRRAGRPSRNIIVPHPFKGDEWLEIGAYDKTWPAVVRYACLLREGTPRKKALASAAAEFGVKEQSIVDWLRRARKRGPIGHYEGGPDD